MKTVVAEIRNERLTIGLDLGDKSSAYCVLDGSGAIVSEHKVRTTPKALSDSASPVGHWRGIPTITPDEDFGGCVGRIDRIVDMPSSVTASCGFGDSRPQG
jgi:hypothetical protein